MLKEWLFFKPFLIIQNSTKNKPKKLIHTKAQNMLLEHEIQLNQKNQMPEGNRRKQEL